MFDFSRRRWVTSGLLGCFSHGGAPSSALAGVSAARFTLATLGTDVADFSRRQSVRFSPLCSCGNSTFACALSAERLSHDFSHFRVGFGHTLLAVPQLCCQSCTRNQFSPGSSPGTGQEEECFPVVFVFFWAFLSPADRQCASSNPYPQA